MKPRFLSIAFMLMALVAVHSLWAAEEKKDKLKDVKCPVSGQPVKEASSVDFNGGKVYFCCNNCPKAFEKDKDKFKAKANHQMAKTEQLVEIACPLTSKAFKKDANLEVAGVKVSFCCNNCKGAIEKLATDDEKITKLFTDVSKSYEAAKKDGK